jgi:putative hydrolase of the HAD superfamily
VIQSCLNKIYRYPEVTDVISSLASEYKLIVASGTPLELLHLLLRDIKPYFVRVFSSISHYRQVKNPDFYLRICEEMGVKPDQVIHVGDNWQFDFLNARQVGINAFHIDRSGRNHQDSLSDLTQFKHVLTHPA